MIPETETFPIPLQSFGNKHYFPISLPPSAVEAIENDDLLQEILLRLPSQSLFQFKLVAKRWQYLISAPRFSQLWKPKIVSGLFFVTNWYSHYPTYNFIPLDEEITTPKMVPFKRPTSIENPCGLSIVQSCNGLLLCCSNFHNRSESTCNYYVYNPTTNKIRILPQFQNSNKEMMTVGIFLAFDPIKSSHYKVIRICTHEICRNTYQLHVFSSENGTWRLPGNPFPFENLVLHDGVYWKGKIVWLNLNTETFFSFDVDKEEFGEIPKPPIEDEWFYYKIRYFNEWRGHLNFIRYSNTGKMQIYIFELNEEQSRWFLKHRVDGEKFMRNNGEFFGNQLRRNRCFLCVFSFVYGESLKDSCLVLYIPGYVVAYHFQDEKVRKLGDLMLDFNDQHALSTLGCKDVHQYIESLAHV